MSDTIGLSSHQAVEQWKVEQKDDKPTDDQLQQAKLAFTKDQIAKIDVADAPVQSEYTQDSRHPHLVEPPPEMSESDQGGMANLQKKDYDQDATGLLKPKMTKTNVDNMKKPEIFFNESSVKTFAQKNETSLTNTRVSYFFANSNPNLQMSEPFTEVRKEVLTHSLTAPEKKTLEGQSFEEQLSQADASGDLDQLANQLGVTKEQAKEMVREAHTKGGSPNPAVNNFTQGLSDNASANTDSQLQGMAYQNVVNSSGNQINQLATQLQKSPDEVKAMLTEVNSNPSANVPPEIKSLNQSMQTAAQGLMKEPMIDSKGVVQNTLNSPQMSSQIATLSKQLGLPEDQVKKLILESAGNPSANVPLAIKRTAQKIWKESQSFAQRNSVSNLSRQILNAKILLGNEKINRLATFLHLSVQNVKDLMQQALAGVKGVPVQIGNLAKEMQTQSILESMNRLQNMPDKWSGNEVVGSRHDALYSNFVKNHNISGPNADKVKFAYQHPELSDQLNPKHVKAANAIDASIKTDLESSYGVPKSHHAKHLSKNDEISSYLYDAFFEEELNNLLDKGTVTPQQSVQLRQLHYNPEANAQFSPEVEAQFKQIEGSVIPQVNKACGAPPGFKPAPGDDRFTNRMNGEIGLEIQNHLDELVANGTLTASQAQQIKIANSNLQTPVPAELSGISTAVVNSSVNKVSNKFGVDPSSLQVLAPVNYNPTDKVSTMSNNAVRMLDEATNVSSSYLSKIPETNPMKIPYSEFLKVTQMALERMKEYLYFMAETNAEQAKKLSVAQLQKELGKLSEMKAAFAARDAALQKQQSLDIVMYIFMACSFLDLFIWICCGCDINSQTCQITQMVFQIIASIILTVLTFGAASELLILSLARIAATVAEEGVMAAIRILLAAVVDAVAEMVANIAQAAVRTAQEIATAIVKAITTVFRAATEGAGSEAYSEILTMIDNLLRMGAEDGAYAGSAARWASTGSRTITQAVLKVTARVMLKFAEYFIDMVKGIFNGAKDAMEMFARNTLRTLRDLFDAVRAPIETSKEVWANLLARIRNIGVLLQDFAWACQNLDNYEAYATQVGEGVNRSQAAQKIGSIGMAAQSVQQGGQQIVSAEEQQLVAEGEAIIAKMNAWLDQADEVIRFLIRMINKIMAELQGPVEWIESISTDQSNMFKSLSRIGTGIANALKGGSSA